MWKERERDHVTVREGKRERERERERIPSRLCIDSYGAQSHEP